MEDKKKDSQEPKNTRTKENTNEPATEEEEENHIKSFINHLKNLTDELIAKRRKAESQLQNAVKIKGDWIHEYVKWYRQYDSTQIELAELVSLKSPKRQRWQGR